MRHSFASELLNAGMRLEHLQEPLGHDSIRTDLYEEVKAQLITHNYDYFDFIHTLLPTALPLEEFYGEYQPALQKSDSV